MVLKFKKSSEGPLIKLLLLALFIGISFHTFAQRVFTEQQLNANNVIQFDLVANGAGTICLVYYKKSFLNFYILNNKGEVVHQFNEPFRYAPEIVGSSYDANKFTFYHRPRSTKKHGDIAAFTVESNEGAFFKHSNFFIRKERSDELITAFSKGGDFYSLMTSKKTNELRIAKFHGTEEPQVKSFELKQPLSASLMSGEPLIYVNPFTHKTIFQYQTGNKLFLDNGKFYFTSDMANQFKTRLWVVDWEVEESDLLNIPDKNLVYGTTSNSFFYEKSLFRLTFDKIKMNLSAYNIRNGELIKDYTFTANQTLDINKGPIYQFDENTQRSNTLPVERLDKIYNQFSKGNASIFVEKVNENTIKLVVGSYNPTSSGLSIGGGFGSFGNSTGISIGGSKQLTGTRRGTTYFESFLTFPELNISEEKNLTTSDDRISTHLNKNRIDPMTTRVYKYPGGYLHLAYIDQQTGQIKILEFID